MKQTLIGKDTDACYFLSKSLYLLRSTGSSLTQTDRLTYFVSLGNVAFTRKDYMDVFRHLSSATASRDLAKGVALGLFTKSGDKKMTIYTVE